MQTGVAEKSAVLTLQSFRQEAARRMDDWRARNVRALKGWDGIAVIRLFRDKRK